jgi:hypothetical protein
VSYRFEDARSYRMPTHFGPAPGPRQRPEGGYYPTDGALRTELIWASFEADAAQVAALLPEGFEPSERPDVSLELKKMTNIRWLAGRSYSVVTVTTEVVRDGVSGRFKLVLWENLADPIITGREELGYPKMYAEIPDIVRERDRAVGSAAWDGFTFLDLEVSDLGATPFVAAPTGPSWHMKYIPRVGEMGGHDLLQVVLTPEGQGPPVLADRLSGIGSATFHRATWEQLPTLVNIVNGLADLTLGECFSAGLLHAEGGTDLRSQLVVSDS